MAVRLLARAAASPGATAQDGTTPLYLLVSHRHLDRPAALAAALRQSGATFVPLIHDIIPLDYPEYGRPAEAERHRRRMATVSALADGVVVNSYATRDSVARYLPRNFAVHVAPLGVDAPAARHVPEAGIVPEPEERPYFLCVGIIEPRKNHLLLPHVWRRLASLHGDRTPRLLLVGHRGWENENVLDLLDRCPALRGHLVELGTVSDTRLSALLASARALLMPSFAEGFGLPVAEALAHGVPVVCSDLPALREVGKAVPEYLDPPGRACLGSLRPGLRGAGLASSAPTVDPAAWMAMFLLARACAGRFAVRGQRIGASRPILRVTSSFALDCRTVLSRQWRTPSPAWRHAGLGGEGVRTHGLGKEVAGWILRWSNIAMFGST